MATRKKFIPRGAFSQEDPPEISQSEIKSNRSKPKRRKKRQDTLETLERDAKKALGEEDFAEQQWRVMRSFIFSPPERESKRVTQAQGSTFGTIEDLFNLINKEVRSEVGIEEWDFMEDFES